MEPVGVLVGIDREQRGLLVDLTGERQLHDEPVDRRIFVERVDLGVEMRRRDVGGELAVVRDDPDTPARLALAAHVRGAVRVVAHEDRAEPRGHATVDERVDAHLEPFDRQLEERLPVEQLCAHPTPSPGCVAQPSIRR